MSVEVLPTSSNEHINVVRNTAPRYFKEVIDATIRGNVILSLLEKYGQVETKAEASFATVWNARYKLPLVSPFGASSDIEFSENITQEQYHTDVRGYKATDKLGLKDYTMNSGRNQIRSLYDTKSKDIADAFSEALSHDILADGYAAGRSDALIGMKSFLKDDGNCAVGDRVALPSTDTYAGKSIALFAKGGTWTSDMASPYNTALGYDWPLGKGSHQVDWNSPLMANVGSSAWAGSAGWSDSCEEILRFMLLNFRRRCGAKSDRARPYITLLGEVYDAQFRNFYSSRNRQMVQVKEATDLGFPDMLYFDGSWVTGGYEVEAEEALLLYPDMVELFTPQKQLMNPEGPVWSTAHQAYLYIVTMFGNMRWHPRYHGIAKNYADS